MMPNDHSNDYRDHLRSVRWRNMKRAIIKMRGNCCERCGNAANLELHHKTYDRLGKESPSDLELLCSACHKHADRERSAATAARRYGHALNTFATKKYGDGYEFYTDPDEVSAEFDDWLWGQE